MTGSMVSALAVVAVLGILFARTRGLAIAAVAALTFIYPGLIVLVIGLAAGYLFYRCKNN